MEGFSESCCGAPGGFLEHFRHQNASGSLTSRLMVTESKVKAMCIPLLGSEDWRRNSIAPPDPSIQMDELMTIEFHHGRSLETKKDGNVVDAGGIVVYPQLAVNRDPLRANVSYV
ncbi:hypothetical protein AHAS_Ahas15G0046600 [Arachis hypogaea]